MNQNLIALGTQNTQSADHTAQHAVFVADVLGFQTLCTVVIFLPFDNLCEVFLTGIEITEGRLLGSADHGLLDSGADREVHIGDPHGDHIKAFLGRGIGTTLLDQIHGNGVFALPV